MSLFKVPNWDPEELQKRNRQLELKLEVRTEALEVAKSRIKKLELELEKINKHLRGKNEELYDHIYDLESRLEDAEFLHEQALHDAQEWQEKAENATKVVNSAGHLIINDKNQTKVFIDGEEIILNEGDSLKFNYTVELT